MSNPTALAISISMLDAAVNNPTLAECEAEIMAATQEMEAAQRNYRFRVGIALGHIHAGHLYREWCETFEEYCEARWKLPRASAYEWMVAAGVVLNIEAHAVAYAVVIEPLQRVNHARELSRLPADEQAPALMEAREAAQARGRKEPTRYDFERVVTRRLHEPGPRSPQETAHTREQRSLADAIRRFWQRLDADVRSALLSEFAFAMSTNEEHQQDDPNTN